MSDPTPPSPLDPAFFGRVVGVDFSGARLAGRTAWLASCTPRDGRLVLDTLGPLGDLAGDETRDAVLPWLVDQIKASDRCLWAIDLPSPSCPPA